MEYLLPLVRQSQVNEDIGFTFASGLRSLMRQDPDVILVGEIRDRESAEIAIRSAMTGHLVMSTLHTNDAVGAVARLIDMESRSAAAGLLAAGGHRSAAGAAALPAVPDRAARTGDEPALRRGCRGPGMSCGAARRANRRASAGRTAASTAARTGTAGAPRSTRRWR